MTVTNFIRGSDKHLSLLLDQETLAIIPNVAWADEAAGEYGVFATTGEGRLQLSEAGEPLLERRQGAVKIIRQPGPGFRLAASQAMEWACQRLLEVCKFTLAGLNELTTEDYSRGGDGIIRERLTDTLNRVESLLEPLSKIKHVLLIAVLFLTIGCATPPMHVIMTNPHTGEQVYITHHSWGFGLEGAAAAVSAQAAQVKAIQAARQMGYTQMEIVK